MAGRAARRLGAAALALWGGLALAEPALAGGGAVQADDPRAIEQEIEELRIRYTDQHPDIQILKRRLERARQIRAEREARSGGSASQGAPVPPHPPEAPKQ